MKAVIISFLALPVLGLAAQPFTPVAKFAAHPHLDTRAALVTCADGNECPRSYTCCILDSGDYGCCPLVNAVCCTGGNCCPQGTKCVVGGCVRN